MKLKYKILLMRTLLVFSGYMCLFLSGMSVYIPVDEKHITLVGLTYPWLEWMILATIIFLSDMLVISRFQHLFEKFNIQ